MYSVCVCVSGVEGVFRAGLGRKVFWIRGGG